VFEVGTFVLDEIMNNAGDIQHEAALVEMDPFVRAWANKEATDPVILHLSAGLGVKSDVAADAFNLHFAKKAGLVRVRETLMSLPPLIRLFGDALERFGAWPRQFPRRVAGVPLRRMKQGPERLRRGQRT
jgi:hypothetical protein